MAGAGRGRVFPGLHVGQVQAAPPNGIDDDPDDKRAQGWRRAAFMDAGGVLAARAPSGACRPHATRPLQVHPGGPDAGWRASPSPDSARSDAAHKEAETAVRTAIRRILAPYIAILVIYGIIPIRVKPCGLSLHPWRSTLLYVLAVQSLVVLSAHSVAASYRDLLSTEAESAAGVDSRLLAVQSVVHVSSHVIVVVTWCELRLVKLCTHAGKGFLTRHAHMFMFGLAGAAGEGEAVQVRLSRMTRVLPWLTVAFCFTAAPVMVGMWCFYLLPNEASLMHSLSHLIQVVFLVSAMSLFAVCCMLLRDLAVGLSTKLKEELSGGGISATRLEEFRKAWMGLRAMADCLGALPLSGLGLLAYLLVMITLLSYQTVVSYNNNYPLLFVSSFAMLLVCQVSVITIFDTAQRFSDAMTLSFYEPLEAQSWRGLPPDLLTEHQQFLSTISCSPAEVTFAGMVTIRRSTYLSMMAAIATYLIVLFQLRQADEDLTARPSNTTTAPDLKLH